MLSGDRAGPLGRVMHVMARSLQPGAAGMMSQDPYVRAEPGDMDEGLIMQAHWKHHRQRNAASAWRPSSRAMHGPPVCSWAVWVLAHVLTGVGVAAEPTSAGDRVVEGTTNRACEISFTSRKAYADPFNDVTVDAVVTAPDGSTQVVPAFWAGGQTWRIRYSAPRPGDYRFQTRCSDAANADLQGASGIIRLGKYEGDNPFYRHGPVRVASDRKHFEHADGTPFLWLGDTWWMGLCKRLKWPEEFKALTADRIDKGFNVVQIVAGLYPDMPAFDERGANEAGFPWQRNYARINPAYFDAADLRIAHLADSGLAPCIRGEAQNSSQHPDRACR
jgi:Protein of unknown function (DUF4038)/Domain of unknown function (DUF5060)